MKSDSHLLHAFPFALEMLAGRRGSALYASTIESRLSVGKRLINVKSLGYLFS